MATPALLRPLYLIGFMATGKSTTGLIVATKLERRFVDLDAAVEAEAQRTIPEIFQAEGEAGFRAREQAALRRLVAAGPQVVAVGGGAPAHEDNLDLMLKSGTVVALQASVDELLRRLGDPAAPSRPLLAGLPLRATVEQLLDERAAFYARAHLTVDTTDRAPSQVARQIVTALG